MTHTPSDAHRERDELTLPTTQGPETVQIGVFDRLGAADEAVAGLLELGVAKERISVVCSCDLSPLKSDVETVDGPTGERPLAGGLAGGALGAALGGMTAAAGVAATGGVGLLVAGPLLGGAAAGGFAGGFVGAMVSRGLEPDVVDFYDQALRDDAVLVAVEPPEDPSQPPQDRVRGVLAVNGARFGELPAK